MPDDEFVSSTFDFQYFLFVDDTVARNTFLRVNYWEIALDAWYSRCAALHSRVHQGAHLPVHLVRRLPIASSAQVKLRLRPWAQALISSIIFRVDIAEVYCDTRRAY